MEERVNNLAQFALYLISEKEVKEVGDFYFPLCDYCFTHLDSEIAHDFHEVAGRKGGIGLVYLNILVRQANEEFIKNPTPLLESKVSRLVSKYETKLAEFNERVSKEQYI